MGGSDPEQNVRLATALASAKKAHMPKDNIDNSIKRVCTFLLVKIVLIFYDKLYRVIRIILIGIRPNKSRKHREHNL